MSKQIKMNWNVGRLQYWIFAYSNASKQAGIYICMHMYILAIHMLTLWVGHHDMIHSVLLMQDTQLQSMHTFIHQLTQTPTHPHTCTHTHIPSLPHVIWTCHCISWWIESLMGSKHEVQTFPKHQHFNHTLISVFLYVCVLEEISFIAFVIVTVLVWLGYIKQMHV